MQNLVPSTIVWSPSVNVISKHLDIDWIFIFRDSSLKNRTVITSARFNCKGWPKSGILFWEGRKRTIVTPLTLCQKIQLIGSPQRLMWNQATTQCEQCFPIVSICRSRQQHTVGPNSKILPKVNSLHVISRLFCCSRFTFPFLVIAHTYASYSKFVKLLQL